MKENTSYSDLDSVTDFVEDGVGVVKVDRDDAGLHLQATWQSLYRSGKGVVKISGVFRGGNGNGNQLGLYAYCIYACWGPK